MIDYINLFAMRSAEATTDLIWMVLWVVFGGFLAIKLALWAWRNF